MYRLLCITMSMVFLLNTAIMAEPSVKLSSKYDRTGAKNSSNDTPIISPEKAYRMSFIPGWSGSWNAGFTGKGLIYQPLKIYGAFIMGLGLCLFASIPCYFILDKDMGSSAGVSEMIGWGFCAEFAGMLLYLPFAMSDAEYSSEFIKKYNSGKVDAYKNADKKGVTDGFSFKPYIVWRKKTENERKAFDGLGICLKYNI